MPGIAGGLIAYLGFAGLVRALVAAGAAILEVRREAATLEDVYFEVMGTPADGEAAA